MNERIRELWSQAGGHYNGGNQHTWPEYTIDDPEKFAELIVRECCIALNPMLRDMISRGQGVDLIKLQFGMNPKEITTAMLDASIAQCEQELAKKKSGVEE
jgi:hypothetical protein